MTEAIASLYKVPFPSRRGNRFIDLTGATFWNLKVLCFYDVVENRARWRCLCSCGEITIVSAKNLRSTRSCGHIRSERGRQMLTNYWLSKRAINIA